MSFQQRRERLLAALERPTLLFAGGLVARNYPANTFPYRADSTFLYFFARPEPGSAALLDPQAKTVTLFLPRRTVEDALWSGEQEPFEAAKARHQVSDILPVEELETQVSRLAKGRQLQTLAVADAATTRRAQAITGEDLVFADPLKVGRPELLEAIATLRLSKDADELAIVKRTVEVTKEAHLLAMRHSRPGVVEQTLAGHVDGAFARHGCTAAYETILSVRGEVLHNHAHGNTLAAGDIVLCDAGAEDIATGYCSDVTRCWPVVGFSPEGRDVYDLVVKANVAGIDAVKPGARFRDVHLHVARVLAEGLVAMGLLKGQPSSLVEAGAHAVFFPHGLGHQLGLDVHDLEPFGDHVLYPGGRPRSTQFGLGYLRMDMDLAPGMLFTIEPGLYFVPAILRGAELKSRFKDMVDFARAEKFLAMNGGRGFGGIRIEDNVLCTQTGAEVLTRGIPKLRAELEPLVGTA